MILKYLDLIILSLQKVLLVLFKFFNLIILLFASSIFGQTQFLVNTETDTTLETYNNMVIVEKEELDDKEYDKEFCSMFKIKLEKVKKKSRTFSSGSVAIAEAAVTSCIAETEIP